MRIGILTLPPHSNFGNILQTYALQTTLTRMGHEVSVLKGTWQYPVSLLRMPEVYLKRFIKKFILGQNIAINQEKQYRLERAAIDVNTKKFLDRYIRFTYVKHLKSIRTSDFDAIVVGSDQVWRKSYFSGSWKNEPFENSFLAFTKGWNIKRIAYAGSYGEDTWILNESETAKCKECARLFRGISVREKSAVALCRDHLDCKAVHVLDPTMLLCADDYLDLITDVKPRNQGSLLCYMLDIDQTKRDMIEQIAKYYGLKAFFVNSEFENKQKSLSERVQPPVEEWLAGFRDAKMVVTDSFHGTVFSIIFGKPFLTIGNPKRGMTRFTSLLSLFNLNNRLFTGGNVPFESMEEMEGQLRQAHQHLDEMRIFSKNFLSESLKG